MRNAVFLCAGLLLAGCASPPSQLSQVGIPEFQRFLREAYAHPSRSFLHYQLYAAVRGDQVALHSLFYEALYYAHSPYNYASADEMLTWSIEAALHALGQDRFLAVLTEDSLEVQKAVLESFDERMLRGEFPKVTALRKRLFPHEPSV